MVEKEKNVVIFVLIAGEKLFQPIKEELCFFVKSANQYMI